jgi:glycine/D-amino acid oxidase-like deaminating enzyme
MSLPTHSIIIGSGIFGVTAALELARRGHRVTLVDPGPIPHPDASSTDISKVIRMEYGTDEYHMALVEEALEGWDDWNDHWGGNGTGPLFHECGVLMVCRRPMSTGGFEFESWQLLNRRGHAPQRLDADSIANRFPAWATGNHVDGFYHARGGYAESSKVVVAVLEWAKAEGVTLRQGFRVAQLTRDGGRVVGVTGEDGTVLHADEVVVATGTWVAKLVPELKPVFRSSGHPVFHYAPSNPEAFRAEVFPVFTADIANTGFYGFPLSRTGVVKIATHSEGTVTDPDGPREIPAGAEDHQRAFLRETIPLLADAPVIDSRLCLYADTRDGDFWICRHPNVAGLTVASGGSGHGFKFAPVLGSIIADAMEGADNPWLDRFRWRPEIRLEHGGEEARHGK